MSLKGRSGISACSPGMHGQKNSSWQQCFKGDLQGMPVTTDSISSNTDYDFGKIGEIPVYFGRRFGKHNFGFLGVFWLQPLLPLIQWKTPLWRKSLIFASFEQTRIFSPGAARDHRQSRRCAPAGFYQLSTQPLQNDQDDLNVISSVIIPLSTDYCNWSTPR